MTDGQEAPLGARTQHVVKWVFFHIKPRIPRLKQLKEYKDMFLNYNYNNNKKETNNKETNNKETNHNNKNHLSMCEITKPT